MAGVLPRPLSSGVSTPAASILSVFAATTAITAVLFALDSRVIGVSVVVASGRKRNQ